MAAVAPIRLADYTPWPFALKEIELDVDLRSDHALVTNTMRLEPLVEGQPLELRGVELQLEHLTVDGQLLPAEAWRQLDDGRAAAKRVDRVAGRDAVLDHLDPPRARRDRDAQAPLTRAPADGRAETRPTRFAIT